jgi:putative FmdB family regulatory protein
MPIYEYECPKGCRHEHLQSMRARAPRKCPVCGHVGGQKRQIGTGITPRFKGSGFYETDYKRKK